jgi:hypothetical protein
MGIKRGARYASEAVDEALILAAIAENDTGEGVLKRVIESHLEAKRGPAEYDAWGHASERLKASGRVVKGGAAKGTRYRVG